MRLLITWKPIKFFISVVVKTINKLSPLLSICLLFCLKLDWRDDLDKLTDFPKTIYRKRAIKVFITRLTSRRSPGAFEKDRNYSAEKLLDYRVTLRQFAPDFYMRERGIEQRRVFTSSITLRTWFIVFRDFKMTHVA